MEDGAAGIDGDAGSIGLLLFDLRLAGEREGNERGPSRARENGGDGNVRDRQTDSGHANLLQNGMHAQRQMTAAQKQGRGYEIEVRVQAGDGDERADVRLGGPGETDDFGIDELFAHEADLREQPPDAGVEPEERGGGFFGERDGPIAAADVYELMAGDGGLGFGLKRGEGFRKQYDRAENSDMKAAKPVLTDLELELMHAVWRRRSATVREVFEDLSGRRKIAYTTVLTMMGILERKGHLKKKAGARAYVYTPTRPQKQVVGKMIQDFVNRVFSGSAKPLLVHLIEDPHIAPEDLLEVERLLQARRKKS